MLKALSLEAFGEAVASTEAVPGGGSVSALAGALSAALTAMVARLTLNKEKFAQVAPQMGRLERHGQDLQHRLLGAVDRDAQSYRKVLAAFGMPKTNEDEQQARRLAIQEAFKEAAGVPLEVAGLCLRIMDLADEAVRLGNPDMITDAGVALVLARSAALGALMNVSINLTSLKDSNAAAGMRAAVARLKGDVLQKEEKTLAALPI